MAASAFVEIGSTSGFVTAAARVARGRGLPGGILGARALGRHRGLVAAGGRALGLLHCRIRLGFRVPRPAFLRLLLEALVPVDVRRGLPQCGPLGRRISLVRSAPRHRDGRAVTRGLGARGWRVRCLGGPRRERRQEHRGDPHESSQNRQHGLRQHWFLLEALGEGLPHARAPSPTWPHLGQEMRCDFSSLFPICLSASDAAVDLEPDSRETSPR